MLPRSAGMVTVRTRWPSPSDARCERSRACRSNSRTPMAANASTVDQHDARARARGSAGADGAGSRFGLRRRARSRRLPGDRRPAVPWRTGSGAARRATGARAAPARRTARGCGSAAGAARVTAGGRQGSASSSTSRRWCRRSSRRRCSGIGALVDVEVLRGLGRQHEAQALGLLDHPLRRREQRRGRGGAARRRAAPWRSAR